MSWKRSSEMASPFSVRRARRSYNGINTRRGVAPAPSLSDSFSWRNWLGTVKSPSTTFRPRIKWPTSQRSTSPAVRSKVSLASSRNFRPEGAFYSLRGRFTYKHIKVNIFIYYFLPYQDQHQRLTTSSTDTNGFHHLWVLSSAFDSLLRCQCFRVIVYSLVVWHIV